MNEFIPQIVPQLGEEEANAVSEYMRAGGWVTEFKKTTEFEMALTKATGAKHCVVVSNGTAALSLALLASGVKAGDEVIVPALTMAATATAALMIGAKAVFCDVEEEALSLDPNQIKFTHKTRAVIHVSLNGRAGSLQKVKALCAAENIPLIEDAAQSLGSFLGGQQLGTIGDVGVLSFSSPKIITTGQGGALLTNNVETAQTLRRLKDFGRASAGADIYESVGFNFKFTDLQAVIGLVQLIKLRERAAKKKEIFNFYRQNLPSQTHLLSTDLEYCAPWFMDIFADDREALQAHLKADDIGSRAIYPSLPSQKAFFTSEKFPVAEKAAARGLWMPSSPSLTAQEQQRICDSVRRFYQ